jgi:hypothetical protein
MSMARSFVPACVLALSTRLAMLTVSPIAVTRISCSDLIDPTTTPP